MNNPAVDVVIPAYNCEQTIAQTLKAVQEQTFPNINIVVIDDGSTDKTSQIVQSFRQIKYVYQPNAGPAVARNRGAKESEGEFIFFTDSDCTPERQWVEKALRWFGDHEIAVVAGSYGIANNESLLARCIHQEIIYRHTYLMPSYPKVFGSYNFAIRRNVFDKVGGFNTNYRFASGEDNDLSYKILKTGYKIFFDKGLRVDHRHPSRWMNYLQEQYRHGFWRARMYLDHPEMAHGDNYTFWKDKIEILLAGMIIVSCATVFFHKLWIVLSVAMFFLLAIEFFYGFLITEKKCEGFFLAFVMFLRSFFRTCGLSSGFIHFFPKKR